MLGFWGICSASGAQSQVVPRRYIVGDSQLSPSDSPKRQLDVVRLKPQPTMDNRSSHALLLSIEKELVLFSRDVRFNAASTIQRDSFSPNIQCLDCYTFDTSSVKYNTALVILLRSLLDKYVKSGGVSLKVAFSSAQRLSQQEYEQTHSAAAASKALTNALASSLSVQTSSVSSVSNNNSKEDGATTRPVSTDALLIITVSQNNFEQF